MTFELPELQYSYNSLEPHIDEQTMKIHHDKHHKAYTDKFNAAIEKYPELQKKQAEEILADLNAIPEDVKTAVINNGGGYVNHKFFWTILKKDVDFSLDSEIGNAIKEQYGDFDKFKEEFTTAATTKFGSGWAWLVLNSDGKLEITSTSNQDTPLSQGKTPLLTLDVWEHAYYLKYQNKRPEYVEAFFKVVNWEKVNELYLEAKK